MHRASQFRVVEEPFLGFKMAFVGCRERGSDVLDGSVSFVSWHCTETVFLHAVYSVAKRGSADGNEVAGDCGCFWERGRMVFVSGPVDFAWGLGGSGLDPDGWGWTIELFGVRLDVGSWGGWV